ncbi:hypothetical protein [Microbacterium sp. NPDC057650]|uniref:hypothetical protein n=1 Tax=unclassified Microbacterium TaxID=2609290 RepID=UPI00366FBEE0
MEDQALDEAIVAYLGKGRSSFPRSDEEAVGPVASAHGIDEAVLLNRVRAVVDELMALTIDWPAKSLSEGGREAQQIIAVRHPELGPDALDALRWMFTYNWR